jgi:flagellar motor switch/type III secretory pathway protein FliN
LIQDHSDWLPFDALTNPAITSAFNAAVSEWSNRWFGDRPFELTRVNPQRGNPTLKSAKSEWRAFGQGIFFDWSEKTQFALAEQGLHASVAQSKLSKDDKNLMLGFSERIIDDLAKALGDVVGQDERQSQNGMSAHPYENGGGLELQICSVLNKVVIKSGISSSALTRLRKKQCNRNVPGKIQAVSMEDILGPVVIAYAAEIGSASMSALELHTMVEGDVVVLDQPLAKPLDILAESSGRLLFKAMLGQHEGHLTLTAHEFEGSEA